MSANKPPFPSYGDQQERTGSPSNTKSSQLFPPQLRMGRGQTMGSNPAAARPDLPPNGRPAAFNPYADATQVVRPPTFNTTPFQPSGFQPSGSFAPTIPAPAGSPFGPGPFSPSTGPTAFPPTANNASTGPSAFSPTTGGVSTGSNVFGPSAFLPGGRPATGPTRQLSPSTDAPVGAAPTQSINPSINPFPGQNSPAGAGAPAPFNPSTLAAGNNAGGPPPYGNVTRQLGSPTRQLGNTGALPGDYSGDTGMLTLNQAVKVVRIPVAGKPGEFKTGILPVLSQPTQGNFPPPVTSGGKAKNKNKTIVFVALILLVVIGSVSVLMLHGSGSSSPSSNVQSSTGGGTSKSNGTAPAVATANAQATATAVTESSLIVSDPLSSNAHTWPTGQSNGNDYEFSNGAYHIIPGGDWFGYAILSSQQLPKNYTYTLTMQSVKYDKSNPTSFFGMIVDYKDYGGNKASFYIFRINSGDNISYEFDKYDNRSTGSDGSPMQKLFPDDGGDVGTGKGNGKELTSPHGANVYSISEKDGTFTLLVNNVKIGSVKDTTFTTGGLGMCVNQKGSDVAFTNLLLLNN